MHTASRKIFAYSLKTVGRAIAPVLSRRLPGFNPTSGHVVFVVDKVVFSEYFGFPRHLSFHRLLHTHHHLSSGAGTVGQLVADVPSGRSLTPPSETKHKHTHTHWTFYQFELDVVLFLTTQLILIA
jgi:hypothetical protein